MKKLSLFFLLPALIMTLAACDTTPSNEENTNSSYGEEENDISSTANSHDQTDQTALPEEGEEVAVITTDLGDITIRFFPDAAPKAVENFITHAKQGYYDGIIFHRVIPNFMIQGGDPTGTGTGGESIWKTPFEDEFSPDLSNIRGAVSMANAGPRTNGSQFFINERDNPYLDGYDANGKAKDCKPGVSCHTVFGQVISGMEVVEQIAEVPTNSMDKPVNDIEMTVKIVPYQPE